MYLQCFLGRSAPYMSYSYLVQSGRSRTTAPAPVTKSSRPRCLFNRCSNFEKENDEEIDLHVLAQNDIRKRGNAVLQANQPYLRLLERVRIYITSILMMSNMPDKAYLYRPSDESSGLRMDSPSLILLGQKALCSQDAS